MPAARRGGGGERGTCIMLLLVAVSAYMPSGELFKEGKRSPEGIYAENMQQTTVA